MAKVTRRANYPGGDPVKWFRGKVERVESGLGDALQESMDLGAEYMRYNILTRGTEKSGKTGRVETRQMLDDVDSAVTTSAAGRQTGRFGWIRNREDYYALQEGGFEHVGGSTVEGMYALVDAAEAALEEFRKLKEQAIRDA